MVFYHGAGFLFGPSLLDQPEMGRASPLAAGRAESPNRTLPDEEDYSIKG